MMHKMDVKRPFGTLRALIKKNRIPKIISIGVFMCRQKHYPPEGKMVLKFVQVKSFLGKQNAFDNGILIF